MTGNARMLDKCVKPRATIILLYISKGAPYRQVPRLTPENKSISGLYEMEEKKKRPTKIKKVVRTR